MHAAVAAPDFDAARDARGKLYRYRIFNAPSGRSGARERYAWHLWYPLDLDRLRAAAAVTWSAHTISPALRARAARASRPSARSAASACGGDVHEVLIDVEGDGFLYNQVRNMVGTLVEVGRGHWPPERVPEILASRDRRQAGPTAPPHGLCLQWVRYARLRR